MGYEKTIHGLDGIRLFKTYTLSMEDKMVAGAFGCPRNYGTEIQYLSILAVAKCPLPQQPDHGRVIVSPHRPIVGATATYSCDVNYHFVHGNNIRLCRTHGQWSGIQPICGMLTALLGCLPWGQDMMIFTERSCDHKSPLNSSHGFFDSSDG